MNSPMIFTAIISVLTFGIGLGIGIIVGLSWQKMDLDVFSSEPGDQ